MSVPSATVKAEPVAIAGVAATILSMIVEFAHLSLSQDQQSAIVAVVILAAAMFARSRVTPVA